MARDLRLVLPRRGTAPEPDEGAGRDEGRHVARELEARGIAIRAASRRTIDEEHSGAYKDVADVVAVVTGAGLARLVARLEPFAVVKG